MIMMFMMMIMMRIMIEMLITMMIAMIIIKSSTSHLSTPTTLGLKISINEPCGLGICVTEIFTHYNNVDQRWYVVYRRC